YYTAHPPALHSFPTRRSSDLFIGMTAASLLTFLALGLLNITTPAAIITATVLLLISASGVIAMLIPYAAEIYPVHLRGTGAGLVDRKSTRLNSSHVKISYAVF